MYKNVLIATDGSNLSTNGLNQGLQLAKVIGASVTVITATEMWTTLQVVEDAQSHITNSVKKYEDAAADAAKRILASAEEAAKKLGVPCDCVHAADKHPPEAIIETANAKGSDLIVMASHGRRGIKRVLLGSVASEVLSNTKIPVLIVR